MIAILGITHDIVDDITTKQLIRSVYVQRIEFLKRYCNGHHEGVSILRKRSQQGSSERRFMKKSGRTEIATRKRPKNVMRCIYFSNIQENITILL